MNFVNTLLHSLLVSDLRGGGGSSQIEWSRTMLKLICQTYILAPPGRFYIAQYVGLVGNF
jgi:hypothetical protein